MSNYVFYFSPTKSTEKITKTIAEEFTSYQSFDLSKQNFEVTNAFSKDDICIVGVPSYGGRVPAVALERMKNMKGHKTPAILVVSYGNRHYDDTFLELQDFLEERGFQCIAAIAAIAEHSIMHQFAKGRPDVNDIKQLKDYSSKIIDCLLKHEEFEKLSLPGNRPYKEYHGVPLKPKVSNACTSCGACANVCPVQAIPMDAPNQTNTDICISCMRCIEVCPAHARTVNKLMLKVASLKMKKNCSEPKENELFLANFKK